VEVLLLLQKQFKGILNIEFICLPLYLPQTYNDEKHGVPDCQIQVIRLLIRSYPERCIELHLTNSTDQSYAGFMTDKNQYQYK
jgi:hypothetical protein